VRILLTVAYDGTKYFGWQRQNDFVSIQETLEIALSKLFNKKILVIGASRTDTGVHAMGQRAVLDIETTIPLTNLPYAINNYLPKDIRVHKAMEVQENFHPQYDAKNKTYRYKIYNAPFQNPVLNSYTWHVPKKLDIEKMREASKHILGEHNFSAFCASGATSKTRVRTVYNLEIYKEDEMIFFDINGNGFLYNMVRIIAGTLVYVGIHKISPSDIPKIISSEERGKAGKTAPPEGLTLMCINY